jgi:methylmalonyl-CoA/ethylmalonyl-CoA epimerase
MSGQSSEFGLREIRQVSVPVRDLERAMAFYRDKLGMRHMFTSNGLAFFDCNGIRLLLSVPEKGEFDHPGSVIYFKVGDIHHAYRTLEERGVQMTDEPHVIAKLGNIDVWMAFFRDSENNLLSITSEVPSTSN